MALTQHQITRAATLVAGPDSLRAAAAQLRAEFAGLPTSVVDAMDMRDEAPALRIGDRAIYLARSDGHCWTVTTDPAHADAIVLAQA